MEEQQINNQLIKSFKTNQIYEEEGICGFDIHSTKALITYNKVLYQYDLVKHEITAKTNLESNMIAVAIHPNNEQVFAIGDQRVESYDDILMISPTLITTVNGQVNSIKYHQRNIGITSDENNLILYRDSKITRCRPGHDGKTINCAFDPKQRFICSIGYDGCLIIYQLSQIPQLLQRYTISKELNENSLQRFGCDFQPSGESLWISGKINAQYIMTEDDPQELQQQYQILHKSEICIILWVKQNCLLTASLDGEIKMWHFQSFTDISLYWNLNINNTPLFLKYNNTILYIMDSKGMLHETTLDCPLTNYEKIYQSKESALQDLLNNKVKKQQQNIEMEEEQQSQGNEQIQIDEKQGKQSKEKQRNLDQNISIQDILRPGESTISRGRQYLCFNTVGTIILCTNTNMIEFEFFDSTFYKKFKIPNSQRYAMGTLNYRGCVLATKGPNDLDEDGYMVGEGKSLIFFQQFSNDIDDFTLQLPEDEAAELLTIGNDWFAVMSDYGICRIIGFCGLEITQIQTNRPIVSICAYEHLLCILFHDTLPILNNQIIKARVYNIEQNNCEEEFDVFITPFSSLTWIGYSDEGLLTTQDSKGIVRVRTQNNWIEVLRNNKITIFGIQDYKLLFLRTDQLLASQKQVISECNFEYNNLYFFEDEKQQQALKSYLHKTLIYQHELYRWKYFGQYYYARNDDKQNDILQRLTQNLYDQNKLQETQLSLRKLRLELFKYVLSESKEKAIEFFRTHIIEEYDMNAVIALLDQQHQKQPNNKEIQKLITQIKLIQRQNLTKSQQHQIDNKPHSPKKIGFGLQRPIVVKPNFDAPKHLHIQSNQKVQEEDEQEEINLFSAQDRGQQKTLFDLVEKRKPTQQIFGSSNIKKKP